MTWTFGDSSWNQDNCAKTFKLSHIGGQPCEAPPFASPEVLLGSWRHRPSDKDCSRGSYPPAFRHCPFCGSPLEAPVQIDCSAWIPPYGTGSGLKLRPPTGKENANLSTKVTKEIKGQVFKLHSMDGLFAFTVLKLGGKQRQLLAIERQNGRVLLHRPQETNPWVALNGNTGEDSLPAWSWSLASDTDESGFCLPSEQGPVWVTVNWTTNRLQLNRSPGRSVGGAVSLGQQIFAPVLRNGEFAIVTRGSDNPVWRDCVAGSNPLNIAGCLRNPPHQLQSHSSDEGFLGIPVRDEGRQIVYWPCRQGYLRLARVTGGTDFGWEYQPWETDSHPATAIMELGPPYYKSGSRPGFWQLCEDRDEDQRDSTVMKIIKLGGNPQSDTERVDCGQFMTTGRASFAWTLDHWTDVHRNDPRIQEQTELRCPLLEIEGRSRVLIAKVSPWAEREEFGRFTDLFYQSNLKTTSFVRFVIEGDGVPEKALYAEGVEGVPGSDGQQNGSLFRINLAQIPELAVFVYQQSLCINFPDNVCYRWPLSIMEG